MKSVFRTESGRIRRPSLGTVLGFMALMVALGGTASGLSGKNSVDDNDVQKNAIDTANLLGETVKASDIKSGAVQDTELGTIVARVDTTSIGNGASGNATASCQSGEQMIGGGGHTQQSASDAIFHGSFPSVGNVVVTDGNTFDDWTASATNAAGGLTNVDVKAWAICLQ